MVKLWKVLCVSSLISLAACITLEGRPPRHRRTPQANHAIVVPSVMRFWEWDAAIRSALLGIFGSAAVAFVLWRGQAREAKWATTLKMLQEFNSPEFSKIRPAARNFLLDHIEINYGNLDNLEATEAVCVGREAVFAVMRFYHRLSVLAIHRRLVDSVALDLFGNVFAWWWGFSYQYQSQRLDWRVKEDIIDLEKYFVRLATKKYKKKYGTEWGRWVQTGVRERGMAPKIA